MLGVVEVPRREVLIFEIDGRRFGLLASEVRELVRAVTITPLPLAPAAVVGVVNLRGQVIAVLDPRPLLGLSAQPADPTHHLIIARARGRDLALRVDRALELTGSEESAEPFACGAWTVAVAKLDDGLVPILNLEALLSPAETDSLGAAIDERGHPGDGGGRP
jgi:purine-binding chemotaxis protein CheW